MNDRKGENDLGENMLFQVSLTGKRSWGETFQSIEAFRNLIRAIFERESLAADSKISNLSPGTNAVFRIGKYVIKIFAPTESGFDTEKDFERELLAIRHAYAADIPVPHVAAAGQLTATYLFRYIIMDYIEGREAGDVLPFYNGAEKERFVSNLKKMLQRLNVKPDSFSWEDNLLEKAMHNDRWNAFSPLFQEERRQIINDITLTEPVYVHGDLTGENVLIGTDGTVYLIDFADSLFAPLEYEYPAVVFELFKADPALVAAFAGDTPQEVFLGKLFGALLLHDYGSFMIQSFYPKWTGKDITDLTSPLEIRDLLREKLF
jgi:Ser/Thr protein kinase RdoA (MazF antagonist)